MIAVSTTYHCWFPFITYMHSSRSANIILRTFPSRIQRSFHINNYKMENQKGQGVSHASDSQVPQGVQEKVKHIEMRYNGIANALYRFPPVLSTSSLTLCTTPTATKIPARFRTLRASPSCRRLSSRDCQRRWRKQCPTLSTIPVVASDLTFATSRTPVVEEFGLDVDGIYITLDVFT